MHGLQRFLKSLNPKKEEQGILIYGRTYKIWREGNYLGTATWTGDEDVGDSFQNPVFDEELGYYTQQVYVADKWELVINNKK